MEGNSYYYGSYVDSSQNVHDTESFGVAQEHGPTHRPALFSQSSSPMYSFSAQEGYSGRGITIVSPTDSTAGGGRFRTYAPPEESQPPLHPESGLILTTQTVYHPRSDITGFATASAATVLSSSSPQHSPVHPHPHDRPAATALPGWNSHHQPGFDFTDETQMVFRGAANIQVLEEQPAELGPWGNIYGSSASGPSTCVFTSPKPRTIKGKLRSNGRDSKPEPIQTGLSDTVSRRRSTKSSGIRGKGKRQSAATALSPSPIQQAIISPTSTLASDENNEDDFGSDQANTAATTQSRNPVARARHNKVEQKYRHRLNHHFEQLLSVLPNSINDPHHLSAEGGGHTAGHHAFSPANSSRGGNSGHHHVSLERERRVSKGEVLDRARLHIQTLQDDGARLEAENAELKQMWIGYCQAQKEVRGRRVIASGSGAGSSGQHSPVGREDVKF